jgi:formylglycine-generating enzyme required for sulfatase activity
MPAQAAQEREFLGQAGAGLRGSRPGGNQDLQGFVGRFELGLQEPGGRNGAPGSYTYSMLPDSGLPGQAGYANYANFPVNWVTWGDAARFCNWLQNGQPSGAEGPSTTETGAYTLSGATTAAALMAATRNPGATYVLPTADEWYKAAYYKGGSTNAGYWLYPTQSDTAPINILSATGTNNANFHDQYGTGNGGFTDPINCLTAVGDFANSPGPYGTYDMGGDVMQWTETAVGSSFRGIWGGGYGEPSVDIESSSAGSYYYPLSSSDSIGFRVEALPEPSSIALVLAGAAALAVWRGRRRIRA